ncbi:zinc ABC transporter substrate-binding protein [Nocardioides salsibiostraticola]
MMTAKRTWAALLLPLGLLTACGTDASSDSETTIAVGFYPLEFLAQRVAGDTYTVENLTTPGAEPHDLELGIAETVTVSNAALVVYESGFQPAIDASVDENAEGATLDATAVVELETLDSGETDPHFWLDPLRMADVSDALAERLTEIDPEGEETFVANAQALRADLEALDQEYTQALENCARATVVVNHDAFGYLEKYGLKLHSILGLSPDAEPTAADLQDVRSVVETDGITTVFSETLVSPKLAETLASDLGIDTAVLDPLEGLSDDSADADYLSVMRSNLAALRLANDCR